MPPRRAWPNSSSPAAHRLHRALLGHRALGHDHDREEAPTRVAALDQAADLVDVEGPLGDQDHVRAAREPGVQGDPARVTPHHLDDHHSVVRLGGGMQTVDGVRRDLHGGVEPEGHVGSRKVVVDRLRHPDHRQVVLAMQARRGSERVLAADRDQPGESRGFERRADQLGAVVALEGVRARRAQDRAPARQDAARRFDAEVLVNAFERAAPAVPKADDVVSVIVDPPAHNGADDRVQARAVASPREHADPHARHDTQARQNAAPWNSHAHQPGGR